MAAGTKVYGGGDSDKLRSALLCAGFGVQGLNGCIFSDTRKTSRRLKLWIGSSIYEAPQAQQLKLEQWLKKMFGGRYVGAYFTEFSGRPYGPAVKSFCVRLKKM